MIILLYEPDIAVQILGNLINKPALLIEYDYLNLTKDDFKDKFHKLIFWCVNYLYKKLGISKIDALTINELLLKYPNEYELYKANNGDNFVEIASEVANLEKYEYCVNRLKKLNYLDELQQNGIDISSIYDPNNNIVMLKFDEMTVEDIASELEKKILNIKTKYETGKKVSVRIDENIENLLEKFKIQPEIGVDFPIPTLSKILKGFRKKRLYLHSALSGRGKTRMMASFASYIAFNQDKKTLFITTEQDVEEVQTMILANLSEVDEGNIIVYDFNEEQKNRIINALNLIKSKADNLYIVYMPDYTPEKIEQCIKLYKMQYGIEYVFFDYIKTTVEMLSDISSRAKVANLRSDNVLYIFAEKLKRLAVKLDIGIYTATQLNAEAYNTKEYDERLLRGAKAIADAVDVGMIISELRQKDVEALEGIIDTLYIPDLCLHIYKNRRGRKNIKIYLQSNHGICKYIEVVALNEFGDKI